MIWMYVGLTLVSLFLAWLVVTMFMTENGERKSGSFIVFLLVFGAVSGLGRSFILPKFEASYNAKQVDAELSKNVAFAALKQYDATGYANLTNTFKQALNEGKTKQEIIALSTGSMISLLKKKVVQASDEAALKYMVGYSQMLSTVQDKDPEACYNMLHPSPSAAAVDVTKYASPEQVQAQFQNMAEVIRSASTMQQLPPLEVAVKPTLDPIVAELVRLYGRDVLMLLQAGGAQSNVPNNFSPRVVPDKSRICQMEAAMIRLIVKQPPDAAGKLVRYAASKD